MIGFYNYSVIVTYIGVALSVSGMALASTGQFKFAILCLALAGACDTFDGKIARAMKNRTKEMEIFGIQIDSLCDMVAGMAQAKALTRQDMDDLQKLIDTLRRGEEK